jgi:hypothetical protein
MNTQQPTPTTQDKNEPEHFDFGVAIRHLKDKKEVARTGWNGKRMFLFIIQGSNDIAKLNGYGFGEYENEPTFQDAIFMRTADNKLVPWLASQTDVLADDWVIYSATH